jgi:hypothetical protein
MEKQTKNNYCYYILLLTVIQCKQRCTRTLPCNVTVVDLIVVYLTSLCVNWAFFGMSGPLKRSFHSCFKLAHSCHQKKAQFTHERVEYKVFLFDEPLKGSKSL